MNLTFKRLLAVFMTLSMLLGLVIPITAETGEDIVVYSLIYIANGAEGAPPPGPFTLEEGEEHIVGYPEQMSNPPHYFFGWNTEADGSGNSYFPGDIFTMGNSDTKLFAIWRSVAVMLDASEVEFSSDIYNIPSGSVKIETEGTWYYLFGEHYFQPNAGDSFDTLGAVFAENNLINGIEAGDRARIFKADDNNSISIESFIDVVFTTENIGLGTLSAIETFGVNMTIAETGDEKYILGNQTAFYDFNNIQNGGNHPDWVRIPGDGNDTLWFGYGAGLDGQVNPNGTVGMRIGRYDPSGTSIVSNNNSVSRVINGVIEWEISCTKAEPWGDNSYLLARLDDNNRSAYAVHCTLNSVRFGKLDLNGNIHTGISGGTFTVYGSKNISFTPAAVTPEKHMRLVFVGDYIALYMDDELVGEYFDPNPLSGNHVAAAISGQRTYWYFDNIGIYEAELKEEYTEYWLHYDANGGIGNPPVSVRMGENETYSVEKQGLIKNLPYGFVKWNTQPDGLGVDYYPDDIFTMGSENVTLYAVWEILDMEIEVDFSTDIYSLPSGSAKIETLGAWYYITGNHSFVPQPDPETNINTIDGAALAYDGIIPGVVAGNSVRLYLVDGENEIIGYADVTFVRENIGALGTVKYFDDFNDRTEDSDSNTHPDWVGAGTFHHFHGKTADGQNPNGTVGLRLGRWTQAGYVDWATAKNINPEAVIENGIIEWEIALSVDVGWGGSGHFLARINEDETSAYIVNFSTNSVRLGKIELNGDILTQQDMSRFTQFISGTASFKSPVGNVAQTPVTKMKLIMQDDYLALYMNGVLVGEYYDPNPLSGGGIALSSTGPQTYWTFDNIKISELDIPKGVVNSLAFNAPDAPVTDLRAQTVYIPGDSQHNGKINWSPALSGFNSFIENTEYTAQITLSLKSYLELAEDFSETDIIGLPETSGFVKSINVDIFDETTVIITIEYFETEEGLGAGTVYYVDSVGGNDGNIGNNINAPWQSIEKVNSYTFKPGDTILFKMGSEWNNVTLTPKGSGNANNPIIIDAYDDNHPDGFVADGVVLSGDDTDKPLINANQIRRPVHERQRADLWDTGISAAILLQNVEYWEVNNMQVTNYGEPNWRYFHTFGVYVSAVEYGTMEHIYIRDIYVRDVFGAYGGNQEWFSGGIMYKAEGRLVDINDPESLVPSKFNNLLIENNYLERVCATGISGCLYYYGGRGWSMNDFRDPTPDSPFAIAYRSTNVFIRGNIMQGIGGNGIVVSNGAGTVVEYNILRGGMLASSGAAVGIWCFDSVNTVIQYNEVSGFMGTLDGQAFDIDYYTANTTIQYNYTHNNAGGFILICTPNQALNSTNVIRYNLSVNDGSESGWNSPYCGRLITFGGGADSTHIYNNTFYIGPDQTGGRRIFHSYDWDGALSDNLWVDNNMFILEAPDIIFLSNYRDFGNKQPRNLEGILTFRNNVYLGAAFEDPDFMRIELRGVSGTEYWGEMPGAININPIVSANADRSYWDTCEDTTYLSSGDASNYFYSPNGALFGADLGRDAFVLKPELSGELFEKGIIIDEENIYDVIPGYDTPRLPREENITVGGKFYGSNIFERGTHMWPYVEWEFTNYNYGIDFANDIVNCNKPRTPGALSGIDYIPDRLPSPEISVSAASNGVSVSVTKPVDGAATYKLVYGMVHSYGYESRVIYSSNGEFNINNLNTLSLPEYMKNIVKPYEFFFTVCAVDANEKEGFHSTEKKFVDNSIVNGTDNNPLFEISLPRVERVTDEPVLLPLIAADCVRRITFTGEILGDGTVGEFYTANITESVVDGAIAPDKPHGAFIYSAVNIPKGLSVNADTGEISGKPTVAVTEHNFFLIVTDTATNASKRAEYTITINPQAKKPQAVQNFNATSTAGEITTGTITFTWIDPNGEDSAVKGYELYLTNGGSKWLDTPIIIDIENTTINDGVTSATVSFANIGIIKTGEYDFRIKAINDAGAAAFVYLGGASRYKVSITVEVLEPTAKPKIITNFEAVLNDESITFTWVNPNPEKSVASVTSYLLYKTSGGSVWLEDAVIIDISEVNVDEGITSIILTFEELGIIKSGQYDFRIKAINKIGMASYVYLGGENRYKVPVEIESPIPTAKPKAIADFNATSDGKSVTFTWVNPNNSATAVEYYELYRTNTGNTWQTPIIIDASDVTVDEGISSVTLTLEDLRIEKNGSYDFRIKAFNDVGVSAITYLGGGTSSDPGRYRLNI